MINFNLHDVGSGFPLSRPFKSSALGAGLIAGAGSLINGLFSSNGSKQAAKYQLQAVRETNQANREIADQNNKFNERMWNLQNEYNRPDMQRARLEAAGLNPYLMMDGGSAGIAESAPTADTSGTQIAPDIGNTIAGGYQAMGNSISSAASQIAQMTFQDDLQKANVAKTVAEAKNAHLQNQFDELRNEFAVANFLVNLRLKQKQGDISDYEANYLRDSMQDRLDSVKFQNTLSGSQSSYYSQMAGLTDVQRQIEQTNLDWLPQEKQAGLAATLQNIRTMVSEMGLNYAQAKNAFAMASLNYANEEGLRIDNRLKESTFDLSVKLAKNTVNSEYWNQKNAQLNYSIGNQGFNDSHSVPNRFWRWSGASPAAAGGAIGYTLGKGKVKMNAPKKVKGFR
nr:unnamed protein product [uncultured bacterium]